MRIVDDASACIFVAVEHIRQYFIPALVVRLSVAVERRAPKRLAQKSPHDVRPFVVDRSDDFLVIAHNVHFRRNDHELKADCPFFAVDEFDAQIELETPRFVDEVECTHQRAVVIVERIDHAFQAMFRLHVFYLAAVLFEVSAEEIARLEEDGRRLDRIGAFLEREILRCDPACEVERAVRIGGILREDLRFVSRTILQNSSPVGILLAADVGSRLENQSHRRHGCPKNFRHVLRHMNVRSLQTTRPSVWSRDIRFCRSRTNVPKRGAPSGLKS